MSYFRARSSYCGVHMRELPHVHESQAKPGRALVLKPSRKRCCFYGQTRLRMSSLGSLTLAYLCTGARLSLARVRVPRV